MVPNSWGEALSPEKKTIATLNATLKFALPNALPNALPSLACRRGNKLSFDLLVGQQGRMTRMTAHVALLPNLPAAHVRTVPADFSTLLGNHLVLSSFEKATTHQLQQWPTMNRIAAAQNEPMKPQQLQVLVAKQCFGAPDWQIKITISHVCVQVSPLVAYWIRCTCRCNTPAQWLATRVQDRVIDFFPIAISRSSHLPIR